MDNIERNTNKELVKELKRLKLPTSGNKSALINRLKEHFERLNCGSNGGNASTRNSNGDNSDMRNSDGSNVNGRNLNRRGRNVHSSNGGDSNVRNSNSGNSDDRNTNDDNADESDSNVDDDNDVDGASSIERMIRKKEKELRKLKSKRTNNASNADQSTDDDDTDSASETQHSRRHANRSNRSNMVTDGDAYMDAHSVSKSTFTFNDIENSMNSFSGEGNYRVENWIKEFEQTSKLFKWNELQKVIYSKRLLKGDAKYFMRTIVATSWKDVKDGLLDEFGKKLSSAEAHKLLQSRKKKSGESFREFVFKMREIGNANEIDNESVIQYIVDGISDDQINKMMLFGIKTFEELKIKLEAYEKFKKNEPRKEKRDDKSDGKRASTKNDKRKSSKDEQRCFLCGDTSHAIKSCPTKEKGIKCFRCNVFGHKASDKVCKESDIERKEKEKNSDEKKDEKNVACLNLKTKSIKSVKLGEHKFNALIDTGSDISGIRRSLFEKLDIPFKVGYAQNFKAAGGAKVTAKDYFHEKIDIEGEQFESVFYILSDEDIPTEMIIGNELLFSGEVLLSIKDGKMAIKRVEGEKSQVVSEEKAMMCMLMEKEGEHDFLPIEVKQLISNYVPKRVLETNIELKVELTDKTPIYQKPRRFAPVEKATINKQVDEWLKNGVIKAGSSDFAFQVVLAKKKDNSDRVCIDFRKLNMNLVRDRFPSPLIEDVLDTLQGAKVFSTIDLKNGFFHVPVNKDSQKYLSFVTHNGQYLFLKAPFGCSNSPPVFHKFINETFRDLIIAGIMIAYMDDICIIATSEEEAIDRLKVVLKRASEAGLEINWKKCQFLRKKIEFLGHVIENGFIRPSTMKTIAVRDFKEPTTVKQVQQFLGLTGYFRKFIHGYSTIAKPLSDLTRKENQFVFEKEQKAAFEILKQRLSSDPILRIYRDDAETQLHTDASKAGFGAILMQKDKDDDKFHPVYYMSEKTSRYEEKMDSYLLEVLAVVKALKKFHSYLIGRKFKVISDCSAFKDTMKKKDVDRKVAGWVHDMQRYEFEVEHRKNEQMRHVDALSRLITSIISQEDNLCIKVKKLQGEDDELKHIRTILEQQKQPYNDYILRNGILYKYINGADLLVVPKSMEVEIIRATHDNGHFGVKKVEESLNHQFFIPKAKDKIQQVISSCVPCILSERKQGKGEGFLHSIEKGDAPLDTYHIDHLGPMVATCKQYKYLFVVVDAFSKFVWIYPTKTTNAKEVLDKMNFQQQTFGNPRRIVSDKGAAFTSENFEKYCEEEKIEHIKTTTGMPRANGQVERINRAIIAVLTKMSIEDPSKWYKHVSALQRSLNSTYNRSIASTPFKLLFGVSMKQKNDVNMMNALEESFANQFNEQREEERKRAKEQIAKVQAENRKTFNAKRKDANNYVVNDLVAIKRTQFVNGNKLSEHFYGPYRITKIKANERYDVEKMGNHAGPNVTSTSAEYMKRWISPGSK